MKVAVRSFTARYDGRDEQIVAGRDHLAPDHEIVQRFPDCFEEAPDRGLTDSRGFEFRATDPRDGHVEPLYSGDQLNRALSEAERRALAERNAQIPGAVEGPPAPPSRRNLGGGPGAEERDAALRTIEAHPELSAPAADRLDQVIRKDDPLAIESRYLAAVGDDAYNSAFGKLLADPVQGHLRFTPREQEAVQRVNAAESMRAAMAGSTGPTGGFALPIQIDPTILLSSNGAINPIRELARVLPTTTREFRAVTSEGVTASYGPEGSEVGDDSPTLGQPVIVAERGSSFVPFSIEVGQDWGSLQAELERLISDARDVLDATKFLTGSGTDEPAGVLTGLSTSQRVQTATTAVYAIADVYALKQAVPPRFQPNATYLMAGATIDATYRFVAAGDTDEPALVSPARDSILGKPLRELSTLVATLTTTGAKIAVAGDFLAGYTITDRLGMSAELIPTLFGTANNRPTGQRGLVVWWRTGAKVVVPNALRYLEIK